MAEDFERMQDIGDMEVEGDSLSEPERNEDAELPPTLIVTNIIGIVFSNDTAKNDFEELFQDIDENAHFQYLRSFRRALVHFSSSLHASKARIHLDETDFYGRTIRCYFAQPRAETTDDHLLPPPLEKQFLISPPASPPIGWESVKEAEPVINYDLLRAISNLGPGQAHEIHPPSDNKPAIIVHVCEDLEHETGSKPKIEHTKCPERK